MIPQVEPLPEEPTSAQGHESEAAPAPAQVQALKAQSISTEPPIEAPASHPDRPSSHFQREQASQLEDDIQIHTGRKCGDELNGWRCRSMLLLVSICEGPKLAQNAGIGCKARSSLYSCQDTDTDMHAKQKWCTLI